MSLSYFSKLTPAQISDLSIDQKDQLLLLLQKHVLKSTSPFYIRQSPSKKVKIPRQLSYKSFVRLHMPNIIRKYKNRLRGGSITQEQNSRNREGRMEFKQEIGSVIRRKLKNFEKHHYQVINPQNKQALKCAICLQMFVCPILTNCGHTFCLQCLDQCLLFSNNCPSCRENIRGSELIKCTILNTIIEDCLTNTENEGHLAYQHRLDLFGSWKAKRFIKADDVKVGVILDVRDTQNIWCQGTVINIEYSQQKNTPTSLLIHFNRWNKVYDELIELSSHRLAPLQFFTSRVDIPRYNLSLEDDNLRGLVVTGPPVQINQPSDQNLIEAVESESEPIVQPIIPTDNINNEDFSLLGRRVQQILQGWDIIIRMSNNRQQIQPNISQEEVSNQQGIQIQQNGQQPQ